MAFRTDRLKARMSAAGLNQRSLALAAGLHEDRVRNILRGRSRNPRADTVDALASALDVPAAWLLGQRATPMLSSLVSDTAVSATTMATIPELDVRTGGDTLADDGNRIAHWGLPATWLVAMTGPRSDDIRIIEVQGNSMEPSLSSGDKVVVDRRQTVPSPPGYFVLRDGLGIVIKQIEHIPNTNPPCLTIKSVNRDYDTYEVARDQISIVGRVVAAIRRM